LLSSDIYTNNFSVQKVSPVFEITPLLRVLKAIVSFPNLCPRLKKCCMFSSCMEYVEECDDIREMLFVFSTSHSLTWH